MKKVLVVLLAMVSVAAHAGSTAAERMAEMDKRIAAKENILNSVKQKFEAVKAGDGSVTISFTGHEMKAVISAYSLVKLADSLSKRTSIFQVIDGKIASIDTSKASLLLGTLPKETLKFSARITNAVVAGGSVVGLAAMTGMEVIEASPNVWNLTVDAAEATTLATCAGIADLVVGL